MSVTRIHFAKPIMDIVSKRIDDKSKKLVWYGGKSTLAVISDAVKLHGNKIDFYITDNPDNIGKRLELSYTNNIPLCNKYVNVDISQSRILSIFHNREDSPQIVDYTIARKLGNNAIYFISSDRAKEMSLKLQALGVKNTNICELPSDNQCLSIRHSFEEDACKYLKRLELKEIHEIEYSILNEFASFCEQHNLRYWLAGGTMLGAVRHNGFIPWDDDVDVYMPDEDYKAFIKIYKSENYELLHYSKDENYPFFFAKLTKKDTSIWHDGFPMHYIMGIYIDVFPLVGFPTDKDMQKKQWQNEHLTMAEWYWYQDIVDLVGKDKMPISIEEIADNLEVQPFDNSDIIGPISVILQKEWLSNLSQFAEYEMIKFEKSEYRIPIDYDTHLRERYGDYMQLPPIEKRTVHGFNMFKAP